MNARFFFPLNQRNENCNATFFHANRKKKPNDVERGLRGVVPNGMKTATTTPNRRAQANDFRNRELKVIYDLVNGVKLKVKFVKTIDSASVSV